MQRRDRIGTILISVLSWGWLIFTCLWVYMWCESYYTSNAMTEQDMVMQIISQVFVIPIAAFFVVRLCCQILNHWINGDYDD